MTISAQEMLAPRGAPPEAAGPMTELDNGSCVAAVPDTRRHENIAPLSTELINTQNAEALARRQREDAIDARVRKVVAAELAKPQQTGVRPR